MKRLNMGWNIETIEDYDPSLAQIPTINPRYNWGSGVFNTPLIFNTLSGLHYDIEYWNPLNLIYSIRSSLIHFACIGVAVPWLFKPAAKGGSNSNAAKMDQT